jgi:hypothetical protein
MHEMPLGVCVLVGCGSYRESPGASMLTPMLTPS